MQLRQLNLQAAFAAACALRKNIENELGAVEHFAREQIFEIAALCGRKFVVENHGSDLLNLQRIFDRFCFTFADVIRRGRLLQFLGDGIDDFRASGIRQLGQFFERILQVPFRNALFLETN